MAYLENRKRKSGANVIYKNYFNNSVISLDGTDMTKIVLTALVVIVYLVMVSKISTDLIPYEVGVLASFGITGAFMAKNKQNMLNGFLLGVLMCPLGLVMAAYLSDRTRTSCRFCSEKIKMTADICPFCKTDLVNKSGSMPPSSD